MTASVDRHAEINIIINKAHFKAPSSTMTGVQIKALGGIAAGNKLFHELPGNQPDAVVADAQSVTLHDGDRFYDLPPGVVG